MIAAVAARAKTAAAPPRGEIIETVRVIEVAHKTGTITETAGAAHAASPTETVGATESPRPSGDTQASRAAEAADVVVIIKETQFPPAAGTSVPNLYGPGPGQKERRMKEGGPSDGNISVEKGVV